MSILEVRPVVTNAITTIMGKVEAGGPLVEGFGEVVCVLLGGCDDL